MRSVVAVAVPSHSSITVSQYMYVYTVHMGMYVWEDTALRNVLAL